jgi:hypothetical protein
MDNPYAGQPLYETAWSHGREYGVANPGLTDLSPPDFSSWQLDDTTRQYVENVWREGARSADDSSAVDQTEPLVVADAGQGEAAEAPDVQPA